MAHQGEWRGGFRCECGVRIRVLFDRDAGTLTYTHGDGEARRTFDRAPLVAWATGDMAERHPMKVWCDEIHEYERMAG